MSFIFWIVLGICRINWEREVESKTKIDTDMELTLKAEGDGNERGPAKENNSSE